QDVNTKTGVVPNPAEGIKNKGDLPDGTKYTWKDTPDVTTAGESTGVIVVTYPDGSKDEVPVTIHVTNPATPTDADKYTPEGQDVNTKTGVVPNPAEGIKNKSDLPDGTKYTWEKTPDVTKPGESTGVIVVTYPDGSSVDLTVKVYVDVVAKENNSKNTAQVITKPVAENNEKKTSATPAQQIKHSEKATLPQTGAKSENTAGILGLVIAAVGSLFGLGAGKKRRDK
ncbi:MAG: LPXTG cell wall anchor domain-containing protein, partial [Lactobacillus johnsonii]|nr:LPXTG cell wall anchor domain-containing protein [Lactobacillus johnsonii]